MFFYETILGKVTLAECEGKITHLCLRNDKLPKDMEIQETPLLREAAAQLQSYLAGELKEFDLPLAPEGTPFMKNVWAKLCDIAYGKTASYKEIAKKIGNPGAARAVGLANNRNPIPIFIPCHRVIGANGSLVGYGSGLELKQQLLDIEQTK